MNPYPYAGSKSEQEQSRVSQPHQISNPFWRFLRSETLTSIYDIGCRTYIEIDCETKQDENSLNAFYYHQQTKPTTLDKVDDFARNALFRFSTQDSQRSCWEKSQTKPSIFSKLHSVFKITITRIIQCRDFRSTTYPGAILVCALVPDAALRGQTRRLITGIL